MNLRWIYTIVLAVASPVIQADEAVITIKGSDTMLPLNRALVAAFSTSTGTKFSVSGGGSSIGLEGLVAGATTICAMSRPLTHDEVVRVRSAGAAPVPTAIGLDGITIAVAASNPVRSLTLEQLREIYSGEAKNWRKFGGPDLAIVAFARDKNSGTHAFMREHVLGSKNWGKDVRFVPSTNEELREMMRTPGGVSFGGLAYFRGRKEVRILAISPQRGKPAILPQESTVRDRTYPIWRTLLYITRGRPSAKVESYLKFVTSSEGQAIVERAGFVSLRSSK